MDDERQRTLKGKRRRYFLATALRREHDGRIRRWRLARLRQATARQEPNPGPKPMLSLPVPTFVPLTLPTEDGSGMGFAS